MADEKQPKETSEKETAEGNAFDLDAAFEEKFHQVQEDLSRMRELSDAQEAPPSREPEEVAEVPEEVLEEVPEEISPEPEQPESQPPPADSREEAQARRVRRKQRCLMLITTRIGSVLRIFAIGVLLFGGSIFLLVGSRPTESVEENRMLATFPSFSVKALLDGSYIEDVMYYYEDTVPGRSFFKQLISDWESFEGLQSEDSVTFIGNVSQIKREEASTVAQTEPAVTDAAEADDADPAQTGALLATETTTTTATEQEEEEEEPIDVGDGIVLVGDRAISVYGGSFSRGETYAQTLNAYQDDLGSDVNIYFLVAPTAVSFYLPDSYADYTGSEIDNIEHINEYLEDVTAVDAYHALEAHTDEAIYARTDHHWLPLGAYYAAQAFAEAADVPFAQLSDYTETTLSGYVGSMYTFTKSAVLQDNPEDFTYYTPTNTYTTRYYDTDFTNEREGNLLISLDQVEPVSWYLVFMGGDERITHVSTDVENDRVLVIIKDSYGNALVPCLTSSFSEIYVIDMRYFDCNAISFIQEVGATDVLFAMNTFSATGTNSEQLEIIRTQ